MYTQLIAIHVRKYHAMNQQVKNTAINDVEVAFVSGFLIGQYTSCNNSQIQYFLYESEGGAASVYQ